jgi:CDP-diacylglycerol--glycerol-3-phosphate 3-phosphatidyltransferase/cardiolipin synthase
MLPADKLGKHKTTWQMITIIFFLLILSVGEFTKAAWLDTAWLIGTHILVPITVLLSLYSGLAYLSKNRHLLDGR